MTNAITTKNIGLEVEPSPEHVRIFDELSVSASPRRAATLLRLREACDALDKKKNEMTLSSISQEIQKRHGSGAGPKAQSISNDPEGLLRYVEARKKELRRVSESLGAPRARKRGADFDLLYDAIRDPDARSRLIDLQDRCVSAETSLARAIAALKVASPGVDPDGLLAGRSFQAQRAGLETEEVAALKKLALILSDPVRLADVGLTRDQSGRIRRIGGTGDELFESALTKALEALARRLSNP